MTQSLARWFRTRTAEQMQALIDGQDRWDATHTCCPAVCASDAMAVMLAYGGLLTDCAATARALRALVRDPTRPLRDRLAALDALAGRLLGEGD